MKWLSSGKRRRLPIVVSAVVAITTALAGCSTSTTGASSSSTTSSPNATSQTTSGGTHSTATATATVRFIWSPSSYRDYFAANKENYWKKYHVNIKPIDILNGGVAVMSALASNSADMAIVGDGPVISSYAKGLKLDIVFIPYSQAGVSGLYASATSGITKNPTSLKGKKIGSVKGSGSDIELHQYLAEHNISTSTVNIVYTTPAEIPALYAKGTIAGAWIFDTPALQLLGAGAKKITTAAEAGINANFETIVVRPAFLSAHKQAVVNTLKALLAGNAYATAHKTVMANYMAPKINLKTTQVTFLLTNEFAPGAKQMLSSSSTYSLVNKNGGVAKALTQFATGLKDEGIITTTPSGLATEVVAGPLKAAAGAT